MRVSAFQLPTSKWWQKEAPPNVIHIASVQQLVDAMVGSAAAVAAEKLLRCWVAALLIVVVTCAAGSCLTAAREAQAQVHAPCSECAAGI